MLYSSVTSNDEITSKKKRLMRQEEATRWVLSGQVIRRFSPDHPNVGPLKKATMRIPPEQVARRVPPNHPGVDSTKQAYKMGSTGSDHKVDSVRPFERRS